MGELKNVKIIKNESDWKIINPGNWNDPELWKKVQNKEECQRKETDPETRENFVYAKKSTVFAGKKETGDEPGMVIKKLYYDQPFHGQMQKKWYFDSSGNLKAKVINCYDAKGNIINEMWFDENNDPDMESSHIYDKNGDFNTSIKNYKKKA